mgnify:CR=1 FL=1
MAADFSHAFEHVGLDVGDLVGQAGFDGGVAAKVGNVWGDDVAELAFDLGEGGVNGEAEEEGSQGITLSGAYLGAGLFDPLVVNRDRLVVGVKLGLDR